jgi:hypothetical protein
MPKKQIQNIAQRDALDQALKPEKGPKQCKKHDLLFDKQLVNNGLSKLFHVKQFCLALSGGGDFWFSLSSVFF